MTYFEASDWLKDNKPIQILDAREFCTAFAHSVTDLASRQNDIIAKNGDESMFAVLHRIFPQVSKVRHIFNLRVRISLTDVTPGMYDGEDTESRERKDHTSRIQ